MATRNFCDICDKPAVKEPELVSVMEQHLGRLLTTEETIHHKDGNKQNNSIDNLELLSNSQHVTLHNQQQVLETGVAAINTPIAIAKRTRTRRWNRIAQRILSVS